MALFDQNSILEEEKNFQQIQLRDDQRPMINAIATTLDQFIDINKLALKGFIWKSLKTMQVDNQLTAEDVANLPPQERAKYALQAFKNLELNLKQVLRNKEDEHYITDAINKTIQFYKENYMNR